MLFGTTLKFRLAYFFTAFFPALFLISFSLMNFSLFAWKEKDTFIIYLSRISGQVILPIILLVTMVISVYSIKKYIKSRQEESFAIPNIAINFNYYSVNFNGRKQGRIINIQDAPKINSGFISFVTSTIAPSIILKFMEGINSLVAFFIVVVFFLLLMLSNDMFPNLTLPIFGINVLVTKDNYNIFYFRQDAEAFTGVKKICSLGNTGTMSRTFVFFDKEFLDDEIGRE